MLVTISLTILFLPCIPTALQHLPLGSDGNKSFEGPTISFPVSPACLLIYLSYKKKVFRKKRDKNNNITAGIENSCVLTYIKVI